MHDEIKRFGLTGTITSDRFIAARDALIKDVEDGMRDEGFVPVLDFTPHFTRNYNTEDETFNFELSLYGIYVGEDKAWQYAGIMAGILIEKSTHPTK